MDPTDQKPSPSNRFRTKKLISEKIGDVLISRSEYESELSIYIMIHLYSYFDICLSCNLDPCQYLIL